MLHASMQRDSIWERRLARLAGAALVLLILALLEPWLPASAPSSVPEPLRALLVRARSTSGGASPPWIGVEFAFYRSENEQYAEVFRGATDTRGELRATSPLGSGWLIGRSAGHARIARAVEIVAGPGEQVVEVEATAGRQLAVEVRVDSDSGQLEPLDGATVLLGPAGELPWGGRTDRLGRWAASDVPLGTVRVQVFAPGYEPFEAETTADLLVRLRPVMTLRVHVKDRGKPAAGAEVHLSGLSLWPARVLETSGQGFVDVQGLTAGKYSLYAEKGARVSVGLLGVELLAERGLRDVTLELLDGKFLEISVVSDQGTAIAEAHVTWSVDGLGEFARRGRTDAHGMLRLGPVAELAGLVHAAAPHFIDRVVPSDEGRLLIALDRAGTVRGRVIDERGFPIEGAEVQVVGTDVHGMPVFVRQTTQNVQSVHFQWALEAERRLIPAGELGVMLGPVPPIPLTHRPVDALVSATFTSGNRGRFQIEGVPPGQIVVLARHPSYLDGKSAAVRLAPGGQVEVEVVLHSGEPLRGRVVDDRDFPVSGARVTAAGRDFSRQIEAGPDGSFEISAAPRDVVLRVTRPERPLRVLLERRLIARAVAEEIELVLPAPRASSQLQVVDESGDAVGLAQVRFVSKNSREPLEETRFTDERGAVEFPDVRGLDVLVEVKAPNFVDQQSPLRLAAEQRITLVRALTVTGRVTTARGRLPASDAEIVLETAKLERRTRANAIGEYVLRGVAPGAARLRASHEEHGSGERQVQIGAGLGGRDVVLPDLDLAPGVELSGRVVDARGFPVANAWVSAEPLSVYLPAASGVADAVQTDAQGEFLVTVFGGREVALYAVLPAVAGGSLLIPAEGRDRVGDLNLALLDIDLAPADELGSVLCSLVLERGRLEIYAVARSAYGARPELEAGDVVLEIDGLVPADLPDARALLSGVVGSQARIVVERRGQRREIRASREAFQR